MPPYPALVRILMVSTLVQCGIVARGDDPATYDPPIARASDEARQAIARFRVPAGLKIELYAAEPMLAHPVAIAPDEHNRWYVVETFRHSDGVTDTRGHMNWLVDDLANRTVADRVAMYKKYLAPEEFARYGIEHERIRLLEDSDGNGKADRSIVFADGFNLPETGLGAGVLPRGQDVYFACIPDLWRLRDTNADGKADTRDALHSGYGVHVQFIGHDLHGLIVGPDGRLYFTVGDRGMNITSAVDGKNPACIDSGAVLRCELDGSNLEIIHIGLRNPQELAFDEFGNLFTVDNNSDGGDRARLVWVVPGGDSGWRNGYQFLERPNQRGPWNSEKMWHTQNDQQPAFLVPPLANFSDGPSGLAYNPGTALRPEDHGRFFLADFRGSSGDSGVRSFAVKPKGAAFELVDERQFLWGLEATDVAFGTDGALYISDWVEGWNKTGKGRIYRLFDPTQAHSSRVESTRTLIAEGMTKSNSNELARLLDHDDQRVRLEAQFELASRVSKVGQPDGVQYYQDLAVLNGVGLGSVRPPPSPRARMHALWAMGQIERTLVSNHSRFLLMMLSDAQPEIRRQAARTLAEVLAHDARPFDGDLEGSILKALGDSDPQVRFHAAIAIGALGKPAFLPAVCLLLAENADSDAYLRHAGVMALSGIAKHNLEAVLAKADDPSAAVRMGVLLALRRLESPEIARFLKDAHPRLALEAARAIHDVPIEAAMPALASMAIDKNSPTPLVRRVIATHLRLGGEADAKALGRFATSEGLTSAQRIEAIDALASWSTAPRLDRVTGLFRPIPTRSGERAASVLAATGVDLLSAEHELVSQACAKAAAALRVEALAPTLAELAKNEERSSNTRVEALRALNAMAAPQLASIVKTVVRDGNRNLRAEALAIMARLNPLEALPVLAEVLESGTTDERQRAFATLGALNAVEANALFVIWLDRLIAGQVPDELKLDLTDAAQTRSVAEIKERLERYEGSLDKDDPLARYQVVLLGGRAERGGRIYREKAELACVRCHNVRGEGGEIGPDLTGIGSMKDRRYLLESIVAPNRQIAEGYETRVLALSDGQIVAGIVKSRDTETLVLVTPEGKTLEIEHRKIEEEKRGESAMPQDLIEKLSRRELRDLLEYLSTLRGSGPESRSQ